MLNVWKLKEVNWNSRFFSKLYFNTCTYCKKVWKIPILFKFILISPPQIIFLNFSFSTIAYHQWYSSGVSHVVVYNINWIYMVIIDSDTRYVLQSALHNLETKDYYNRKKVYTNHINTDNFSNTEYFYITNYIIQYKNN